MNNQIAKKHSSVPNLSIKKTLREIGRNAYVDWIVILFLSSAIALVLIVGGGYLYYAVTRGDIHGADLPAVSTSKPFNRNDLFSVTSFFTARENVTGQVKKGYIGITDPSL